MDETRTDLICKIRIFNEYYPHLNIYNLDKLSTEELCFIYEYKIALAKRMFFFTSRTRGFRVFLSNNSSKDRVYRRY